MHELDGFSKAFIHLALRLSESFTVHAPVFYGGVGEDFSGLIGLARAYFCIRQEFELLRLGKTSSITGWVRDLAAKIQHQHPESKGIGIVGMCMTGGIVLATISHPSIVVGVAAQPSLPSQIPFSSLARREDLGMDHHDVEAAALSETPLLILRYGKDKFCPAERMESIKVTIPSSLFPSQVLQDKLACQVSHATLTDRFRPGRSSEIKEVSN
jgi:dienelactone hydrolase